MPSETWWQRYERLRSDLLHKADAHGFAGANRNATEADRRTRHHDVQDALAALDAHVRGLVDALEEIAGLRMVAGDGFMPDSTSYLRPDQYYHRVQDIITRVALAAPAEREGDTHD